MDINIEVKELTKLENTAELANYLSPEDRQKLKYFFLGAALGRDIQPDPEKTETLEKGDENENYGKN